MRGYATRGRWLIVAFEILSDGRPRAAADIYAEAVKRDLLPAGINKYDMYTQLVTYLRHMLADGRRPRVVQDVDHRWRVNHPADDWPVLQPTPRPPLEPLLEDLRKFRKARPKRLKRRWSTSLAGLDLWRRIWAE